MSSFFKDLVFLSFISQRFYFLTTLLPSLSNFSKSIDFYLLSFLSVLKPYFSVILLYPALVFNSA